MSYSIGSAVSIASSFALKTVPQTSSVISSISKVAFLSLSCLAASFQVMPTILPIAICLLITLAISSSLIRSHTFSCCPGHHYLPISSRRVIPCEWDSVPIQLQRPRVFSPDPYPRNDFVGERGAPVNYRPRAIVMPSRPTFAPPSIIRRDRVGERSSF